MGTGMAQHLLEWNLLLAAAIGGGGLYGILRVAIYGYIQLMLERERRKGTVAVLERLPRGTTMIECVPEGHYRMLHVSELSGQPCLVDPVIGMEGTTDEFGR